MGDLYPKVPSPTFSIISKSLMGEQPNHLRLARAIPRTAAEEELGDSKRGEGVANAATSKKLNNLYSLKEGRKT